MNHPPWRWQRRSRTSPARSSPATSATPTSTPATNARNAVRGMFEEQVGWAVEAEVDYIIAETIGWVEEERSQWMSSRPPVCRPSSRSRSTGDQSPGRAFPGRSRRASGGAGADVVGFNCARGPWMMLPLLRERPAPAAVPYRRAAGAVPHHRGPAAHSSRSPIRPAPDRPGRRPFPVDLDPFTCSRSRSPSSPARRARSARTTWASAAGPARTISAPWPKPSAAPRRPAATAST